jgi:hypothetical protein
MGGSLSLGLLTRACELNILRGCDVAMTGLRARAKIGCLFFGRPLIARSTLVDAPSSALHASSSAPRRGAVSFSRSSSLARLSTRLVIFLIFFAAILTWQPLFGDLHHTGYDAIWDGRLGVNSTSLGNVS